MATRRRRNTPKSASRRSTADAPKETRAARVARERDEALEQQRAAAEVLKIISASRTDLQSVLEVVVRSAARYCKADDVTLFELDGPDLREAAHFGALPHGKKGFRFPCTRGTVAGRVVLERKAVHVSDLQAEAENFPEGSALARRFRHRTIASVPLLREGVAVGTLQIRRTEVNPFTDKQIALLGIFAAQAVIAIENARLLNELRQSLQQQTATADVLKVISRSTFDLQTVLDTLVESAARLCRAPVSTIRLAKDGLYHHAASFGFSPEHKARMVQQPIRPGEGSVVGRVVVRGKTVHLVDTQADPDPELANRSRSGNIHSMLGVPLQREGTPIGVLLLQRTVVQPFTDKEIALAETFADQAVIAIENVRLFEAEQQRSRELSESLERQTATSDVLSIISSSPGELEPVFEAMLAKATRLCEAKFGALYLFEGGGFRVVAVHGSAPPSFVEARRQYPVLPATGGTALGRVAATKQTVQIPDVQAEPAYRSTTAASIGVETGGLRTVLSVPMLKEGELIGTFNLFRQEVRPFTDKQIELVQNFAAQAVIAIENARLLNELRQRTDDLTESLEQQTATSKVLEVISSSPGDLQPVFQVMLENATRICDAKFGTLFRFDGELFHRVAGVGTPPALVEFQERRGPFKPETSERLGRLLRTKAVYHTVDELSEPEPGPPAKYGGARSVVGVPMLKDNEVVGAIIIYRQEVRPFTDKQIALVQNFAAQAVIAIENARLLNELRQRTDDLSEALEQQTATSEVLRVISSSPGDLTPVFNAMLENATKLCGAEFGLFYLDDGDLTRIAAAYNVPPALAASQNVPFRVHPKSGHAETRRTKQVVHIDDIRAMPPYLEGDPRLVAMADLGGARTTVGVPMIKGDALLGVLAIYRKEVRPFTAKQIELVSNFANQAVIAIENTRLLNELRQRTSDLSESLEQQTATSEVLRVISNSLSDTQPVFDAIVQSGLKLFPGATILVALRDQNQVKAAAVAAPDLARAEALRRIFPIPLVREHMNGIAILDRRVVDIPDARNGPPELAVGTSNFLRSGYRATTIMPMLRGDVAIGALSVVRVAPGPISDKQRAVLKTFAAQAVIAIENARLLNELRESLQQQTATSEVLQVISSSPGELEPVFNAMLENAMRICEAKLGNLFLREGNWLRAVAVHGESYYADRYRREPMVDISQNPGTPLDRAIKRKQVIHIPDLRLDQSYLDGNRFIVALADTAGARTELVVPMLKEDEHVGAIVIYRQEVRPFTDKQIALVQNFAAQAVIAIENTRLLNELRQSLEQQTATSEVLKVISSSLGELEPVFQAMLTNAMRLCEARFGHLLLYDGESFHSAHLGDVPAAYREIWERGPLRPNPKTAIGRIAETKQFLQIPDIKADPAYAEGEPLRVATVEIAGARTLLGVPMLKEGQLVGAIIIYRQEVRPFTDKQIALVQNFAAQAVIAIENTRLLNELRESLQQQTATAEVLRVISSSPGELEPVFQNLLDNATRLCAADFGLMAQYDGSAFQLMAQLGGDPAYVEYLQREPFRPGPETLTGRVLQTRGPVQIEDFAKSKGYVDRDPIVVVAVERGGVRTTLGVPMLRENELIGIISLYRQEVRLFTDKQIELLQNFAAQAVIAIENARLLNELRESLEQQTATSEVLKVISSSPTNIQPVLDIICERAEKLCVAETSTVCIVEGELIRGASIHGETEVGVEATRGLFPMRLTDETIAARAIRTHSVCHVADVLSDPQYQQKHAARVRGIRGALAVPMVRGDQVVGAIFVARRQPGLFSDVQVQLLKTFADQAVIAIENVRLFNETKNSLEQQTATADVLKIISRSAFDLRPVLQTLVESAARFCAADKAQIIREKNGGFYTAEAYGYSREFLDYIKNIPIKPERGTASGRALLEGRVVHIGDVRADPEYTLVEASRLGDFRTALSVPMLREGISVGVLTLTRSEVQPFTDKQIELVTTFADQAAIAIENVRLFDEIQDKSRQLEEASQHKSQFLANMSHELRTPLNAILGYTELMADGAYGEPSEKMIGVLKRLESNGKHLLGLINDVLDLSKIEAGQLVLELSDYSIQDIAQTVRSTLEPLAADKKLAFKVEVASRLPPGRGDGRRLTQVLINLVGNAIKFTDAGEVAIKAEANNGAFHVSIRDTGPGISAADQAKLFQEFQQADNAITKKKGGTGLGLAISKRIIEMHGGRIWVESQPGQGSTFAFTLPVIVDEQANVESR